MRCSVLPTHHPLTPHLIIFKMPLPQSTRWCFTINNYTNDHVLHLRQLAPSVSYLIFGTVVYALLKSCTLLNHSTMRFSSPAILAVVFSSIPLLEACPYASTLSLVGNNINNLPKNHPKVANTKRLLQDGGEEILIGLDGRLVGSPYLGNGAFDGTSLLTPLGDGDGTIADLVAGMSSSMGEDMCLIRFQQLPPPAAGDYAFDQNAVDQLAFKKYGDLMVQLFSDLSSPDLHLGAIVHASTTSGFGGVESFCNAGIEPERFCDETRLKGNSLRWPQAVTGYKLTSETGTYHVLMLIDLCIQSNRCQMYVSNSFCCKLLATVQAAKDVVRTWRTTDEGHLPTMDWTFFGGDPNSGGSQIAFWGNDGGLFSKIVRCSDIPTELMYYEYPNGIATSDYIDPTTNLTISEMMYQWWYMYGGFDPETGEQVYHGPTYYWENLDWEYLVSPTESPVVSPTESPVAPGSGATAMTFAASTVMIATGFVLLL